MSKLNIDLNKVTVFKSKTNNESFYVVVGSEHRVDGETFVIAKRQSQPQNLIRLSLDSIKESK